MKRGKNKEENKVEYGTISLPLPLIEKIKKRIKGTGMNSVSAYVSFILRQLLSSPNSNEILSKEEERSINNVCPTDICPT
jgi:hypothetical protein